MTISELCLLFKKPESREQAFRILADSPELSMSELQAKMQASEHRAMIKALANQCAELALDCGRMKTENQTLASANEELQHRVAALELMAEVRGAGTGEGGG